jgi:large subunit ribosomal protein L11
MRKKETIDLLVEGGKATPAGSAPRLSALKVNVDEIFKQINEKTKDYAGMQVQVKVEIDIDSKEYNIIVYPPPVTSLIKKELGIELAKITEEEKAAGKTSVGNLTMEQIVKITRLKLKDLLSKDLRAAVKQTLGVANSMQGVLVENKRPKEIIKEVDEGKWDHLL